MSTALATWMTIPDPLVSPAIYYVKASVPSRGSLESPILNLTRVVNIGLGNFHARASATSVSGFGGILILSVIKLRKL